MSKPLFRVYVDETGDRGWGGSASPTFVVSAAIVRDEERGDLLATLDGINSALGKPPKTVLHWSENVKQHSQRKFVARQIGAAPMILTNAIVMKQPMMGTGSALSDAASMYNYAIRRLLERVSWYVKERGGEAIITFAHVHKFPYARLRSYLRLLEAQSNQIKWEAIRGVKIDQPKRIRQLQIADLAAGSIGTALRPDGLGDFEPAYLHELVPRLYIRRGGSVTSYGMNVIGPSGCMEATYPWWSEFLEACAKRKDRQ
jgi:hypothetical protein